MGLNYQRRPRLEDLRDVPDEVLPTFGREDFNSAQFDDQLIYDKMNKQLDKAQERLSR